MAALIRELKAETAAMKPGTGFHLAPEKLIELLLATLGRIPDDTEGLIEEYLDLGRDLSEMLGNPEIFSMMLTAVMSMGNVPYTHVIDKYKEELGKMGNNAEEIANYLLNGEYSKLKEQNNSNDATITDLKAEIKDLAEENKDLAEEIASKETQISNMKKASVRAMRAANISVKDICKNLKLQRSEVSKILADNDRDD
jgi:DNA-binding Xre family transcriptional regulator